nr:hypothetical protein Q903MT_gene1151 [Picea sitchensis]
MAQAIHRHTPRTFSLLPYKFVEWNRNGADHNHCVLGSPLDLVGIPFDARYLVGSVLLSRV